MLPESVITIHRNAQVKPARPKKGTGRPQDQEGTSGFRRGSNAPMGRQMNLGGARSRTRRLRGGFGPEMAVCAHGPDLGDGFCLGGWAGAPDFRFRCYRNPEIEICQLFEEHDMLYQEVDNIIT